MVEKRKIYSVVAILPEQLKLKKVVGIIFEKDANKNPALLCLLWKLAL
jgi:hypothetical protein